MERRRLASNMVLRAARRRSRSGRAPLDTVEAGGELRTITMTSDDDDDRDDEEFALLVGPWRPATISVNAIPTDFSVLEHDGLWVAIGEAPDLHITLDGEDVALADVRLVSRDNAPVRDM